MAGESDPLAAKAQMSDAAAGWLATRAPSAERRFDLQGFRLVKWVPDAERGTLFVDQVGPWFDLDGSEIILPCSAAFENAIENLPGSWLIRSNIESLDRSTMTIGFPEITLLAQHEWNRVTGETAGTQRRSFLLQLDGLEPTIGQVCEQLIVETFFMHLGHLAWPSGVLISTQEAVDFGLVKQVRNGTRSDDAMIVTAERPVAVVEVKATSRRWSGLRRPVRDRAIGQLIATASANQHLGLDLVVVGAAIEDRQIAVFRLPAERGAARLDWITAYEDWRPARTVQRTRRAREPLADESDDNHTRLAPGTHAHPERPYSRIVKGNIIWAHPQTVGDPFAGGTGGWADPTMSAALKGTSSLLTSESDMELLLPWALGVVVACAPDAIGLVAPADYSGPRATSLTGNLAHPTRARSYAAELVTGACLTFRAWPSVCDATTLGRVRMTGGRLDFGVKLNGTTAERSTAEADILLTLPTGERCGVDVKHSASGHFSAKPSPSMLDVVDEAIARGEISSFHFVTNGSLSRRFKEVVADRSCVFVHENVWPSQADLLRIHLQMLQRVSHNDVLREFGTRLHEQRNNVRSRLFDQYTSLYKAAFGQERDVRWLRVRDQEHLFDTTLQANHSPDPPPRLLAIGGDSNTVVLSRDRNFLRGFPLPAGPYDRGHLLAREAGGAEGIGMNLIPQETRLNRGRGPDGRRWRRLERAAAASPGMMVINRAIYDDSTDVPAWLEVVHVLHDDACTVDRFPNRVDLP